MAKRTLTIEITGESSDAERAVDRVDDKLDDLGNKVVKVGVKTGRGIGGSILSGMLAPLRGLAGIMPALALPAGIAFATAFLGAATPLLLGGVAVLAGGAAAALAAGGALGLGVLLAAQTPQVKKAAESLKGAFADAFSGFGDILAGPVSGALKIFESLAQPLASALRPVLEALGPAVEPFAQGLADLVTNALPGFQRLALVGVDLFGKLGPLLPPIGTALGKVADALASAGPMFDDLVTGTLSILPGILSGVATGLTWLMDAFKGVVAGFQGEQLSEAPSKFEAIGGAIRDAVTYVQQLWSRATALWNGPFGQGIRQAATEVFNFLAAVSPTFALIRAFISGEGIQGSGLLEKLQPITDGVAAVVAAFQQHLPTIMPVVTDITTKVIEGFRRVQQDVGPIMTAVVALIGDALNLIAALVGPVLAIVSRLWEDWGGYITGLIGGIWTAVVGIVQGAINIVRGIIQTVTALIQGDWKGAGEGLKRIWQGVWQAIGGILRGAWQIITSLVSALVGNLTRGFNQARATATSVWNSIRSAVTGAAQSMASMVISAVGRLRSGAISALNGLLGFVRGIPGRIRGALSGLASMASTIGRGFIDGIRRGITGAAGRLASAARNAVRDALGSAKRFLGISSPSKVARRQIGQPFGEGIEVGLLDKLKAVRAAVKRLMPTERMRGVLRRARQRPSNVPVPGPRAGDSPFGPGPRGGPPPPPPAAGALTIEVIVQGSVITDRNLEDVVVAAINRANRGSVGRLAPARRLS